MSCNSCQLNFNSPCSLLCFKTKFSHQLQLSPIHFRFFNQENKNSLKWKILPQLKPATGDLRAVKSTAWNDKATDRERVSNFLDEEDLVTILDPPKQLIPLDPSTYNAAAYIWKKIGDIPDERRHRLLKLLKPRLISRLWEITGTRYEDSKLGKKSASKLLPIGDSSVSPEFWICRSSEGPMPLCWTNGFRKVLFCGGDGNTYGRIFLGGSLMPRISSFSSPLYFTVRQIKEVMSTEQPCDLAYEFGDGLLDIHDFPKGFPRPGKHPKPFDDQVVIYVRHAGPGVLVGQAWQEGKILEQVPKKFCGEILMVQDCNL